jgi:negative regulator of sigma E activity
MENKPSNSSQSLWRRNPSGAAREDLRTHPELELETRLTEALARLSDAPVPSNFTACVLAAIELEEKKSARSEWRWSWRLLWPRVTVAAAVLIFAGVGIQRYETNSQRAALAKTIAMVAGTKTLPNVDALENLDAIQRMSQSAHADGELLVDLQ